MSTKTIIELAAALQAGTITQDYIKNEYGNNMLCSVLAITGGTLAGIAAATVASSIVDEVDAHTGLISVADDIIDSVNPFNWF